MLIKVTIGQVVARAHTIGIVQVAKRGRQRGQKAVTLLTQKRTTNKYILLYF